MLALRHERPEAFPESPEGAPADDESTASERAIVCGACAGTITSPRQRIAVAGAHEHRFMNPGGFLFHIGCFAEALGCTTAGPASEEYPWFPGFAWRIAGCGHCGIHLGWYFLGEARGFFGLILDRLREATAGD